MSQYNKFSLGVLDKATVEQNVFASVLYKYIEALPLKSRAAGLLTFIGNQKIFDTYLNLLRESKKVTIAKLPDTLDLGTLVRGDVPDQLFDALTDRLANDEVAERPKHLVEMALNPSLTDHAAPKINFFTSTSHNVGSYILSLPISERVEAIFNGSAFEMLKKSPSGSMVEVQSVTLGVSELNVTDGKGRLLIDKLEEDQIQQTIDFANGLNSAQLNIFIGRAMVAYTSEAKGLIFRVQNQLPYLYKAERDYMPGIPALYNGTVYNSDIERIREEHGLKNNRLKDRFGASDKAMGLFKANPDVQVDDVVFGLLARVYIQYPDILVKTLPKKVDIGGIIEYLGGSNRSLGVYIGRNAFTAHRYQKKDQSPPQQVEVLLEILAQFVQEGRIQEYINNILIPEAKSRGITDIFAVNDWKMSNKD